MYKQIYLSYLYKFIYFILMPIQIFLLTNIMDVSLYGRIMFIITFFTMLSTFISLGMQNYESISIPKLKVRSQLKVFKVSFLFQLLLYVIIGLILFIFVYIYFNVNIWYIICTYFFYLIYVQIGRFYTYRHRSDISTFMNIFELILFIVLLYYCLPESKYTKENYLELFYIYLIFYIILSLTFLIIFDKKKDFINAPSKLKILKYGIQFGFPLLITDLLWQFIINISSYTFLIYNLDVELGQFALAYKFSNVFYLLTSPLIWIIYPYLVKYYKKDYNHFINIFYMQVKISSSFILIFYVLFLFISKEVVIFISDDTYYNKFLFYFLFFYPLLMTYTYIMYQQFSLEKRNLLMLKLYIKTFIFFMLISLILAPLIGVYGVVLNSIIALIYIFYKLQKKITNISMQGFLVNDFVIITFIYFLIILIQIFIGNSILQIFLSMTIIIIYVIKEKLFSSYYKLFISRDL